MKNSKRFLSLLFISLLLVISGGSWFFASTNQAPQPLAKSPKRTIKALPPPTSEMEEEEEEREKGEEREFEGDQNAREKWFFFQRSYPSGTIPVEARRKAWESRPKGQLNAKVDQKWQLIGPAPTDSAVPNNWGVTSGRINAIAVSPLDPQLVLVGASTGGIWRSTDGGEHFVPTSDNQVDLAVGSIAFSKSNPTIVYAGMGDLNGGYLGTGVLRSTDSGQTWTRINNNSLPAPATVAKIEVAPNNPNRVYLAQYSRLSNGTLFSSGFYLSTDGGVNWTKTLPGLPRDLVIDQANSNTLYLAMARVDQSGSSAGLYRSTDGGNTWMNIFPSPYTRGTIDIRVAVTPANPKVIYIYTGGFTSTAFDVRVVKSTDTGITWTNLGAKGIDTAQFGYNVYIFIDPANESNIYIGSRDIFKSTNGGNSWVNLNNNFTLSNIFQPGRSNTHPDQHAFTFSSNDAQTLYVGNDGGISKSTDGGSNFRSLNATLALNQAYGLTLHPTDAKISYIGSQDNGIQMRQGNTSIWKEFFTGDYGNIVLNPQDPTTLFANFVQGNIFRFVDSNIPEAQVADNSTFGESDGNARIAFIAPLSGNGVNSNLYFGTFRLFISKDLGENWAAPSPNKDLTKGITDQGDDVLNAIAVARSDINVIYTGSAQGRAMVTNDEGLTWKDITSGLPNRFISNIFVDPANAATAYLVVSGFGSGHVFKTTNSGNKWVDISGNLPDIPCNDIIVDPSDNTTLYVGTDIGVFRSTIEGKQWEAFNNGLPPVIVNAFASQPTGLVQLATYGRSAYELQNANADNIPPTVTVIAPNGREMAQAGNQFTINWQSTDNTGVIQHDINLSTNGGRTFSTTIVTGLAGNAQQFVWSVPNLATNQARIQVIARDAMGNSGMDISDADFTIIRSNSGDNTPPTVTITAPKPGDILNGNAMATINFSGTDNVAVTSYNIFFAMDGNSFNTTLATGLSGSTTSFNFKVPAINSNVAAIRVEALDAAGNRGTATVSQLNVITDTTQPTVTVTSPKNKDKLVGGKAFNVTFTSQDNVAIVSHDIQISLDGTNFTPLATGLPGNITSAMVTIPNTKTKMAMIRVIAKDAAGNMGSAVSGKFKIKVKK